MLDNIYYFFSNIKKVKIAKGYSEVVNPSNKQCVAKEDNTGIV